MKLVSKVGMGRWGPSVVKEKYRKSMVHDTPIAKHWAAGQANSQRMDNLMGAGATGQQMGNWADVGKSVGNKWAGRRANGQWLLHYSDLATIWNGLVGRFGGSSGRNARPS